MLSIHTYKDAVLFFTSVRFLFCLCVQLESDLLLSDVISYGAQVTNTTVGLS